ncbi:hypothetical protein ACOMHN_031629 [Nucella lapillus]
MCYTGLHPKASLNLPRSLRTQHLPASHDLRRSKIRQPLPASSRSKPTKSFPTVHNKPDQSLNNAASHSPTTKSFPTIDNKATQFLNNSKYPKPNLVPCGWVPEQFIHANRTQCFLDCKSISDDDGKTFSNNDDNKNRKTRKTSILKCTQVSGKTTISLLSPKEMPCLKNFIKGHCYGEGDTITRVAHYVWFGAYNLTLDAFFSMYSVARFFQPCLILIYGDSIPSGPYWTALIHLLPNIVHVSMDRPREIFGRTVDVVQHCSDVARMKILLEYGGMYLDFDQLLLSSFDDLLAKSTVLGYEYPGLSINNALVLTKPQAEFLQIWLSRYSTFNDSNWAEHSTRLPYKLAKKYSHLVHVMDSFFPLLPPRNLQFYDRRKVADHNWPQLYAFHLYTRDVFHQFYGKRRIDMRDNAIGDAVRYILYGNQKACLTKETK